MSVVVVAAGGTALALAAGSGGPVPPRQPLAGAIHSALAAPEPQGVSGRFTFTNRMLDGIDLRGSNPILSGASGRFWATSDGRFRLELQGNGGDAQVVSDGASWWVYDGTSNTVYRGSVPQDKRSRDAGRTHAVPTVARIQQGLDRLMQHADVSGAQPGDVAGHPAYSVRVSPKQNGGLLGGLALAWDASHGTPLSAAVYARGSSSPVLELRATQISFGPVSTKALSISPPRGAKPVNVSRPAGGDNGTGGRSKKPVTGTSAVQAAIPFHLAAPDSLAGRSRSNVALIGAHGKNPGALVTYGQGLGGIAVIERAAKAPNAGGNGNGPLGRAELPTVSIGGTSAQELSTPLGTVLRFERGGVSYIVLGSVPHAAAEAAARGL